MLKRCSRCQCLLEESQFSWKYKNIKRSYHCKKCSREYIREHYSQNREYYLKKAKKRNHATKQETLMYIAEYLQKHPCIDCGERDIQVLEFDHRERSSKINAVSNLIKQRMSLRKIIAEIAKCDVRCANCHRRKTISETKSWKLQLRP